MVQDVWVGACYLSGAVPVNAIVRTEGARDIADGCGDASCETREESRVKLVRSFLADPYYFGPSYFPSGSYMTAATLQVAPSALQTRR